MGMIKLNRKYQTKSNLHCLLPFNFSSLSQRQITFLGPLEWRNLFGPKSKVFGHEKLVFRSGVGFLFLFVLMDAILQKPLFLENRSLQFLFFTSVASPYIKDQEFMSFVQAQFFLVISTQKLQSEKECKYLNVKNPWSWNANCIYIQEFHDVWQSYREWKDFTYFENIVMIFTSFN